MLYLNILNGVYAGKQIPLRQGVNTLGRSENCTIVIQSQNISKQHLQFEVINDKIIATDLNSTNGTFVNGLKIKSIRLHLGDKIALYDTILELTDKRKLDKENINLKLNSQQLSHVAYNSGNLAYNQSQQPYSLEENQALSGHSSPTPQIQLINDKAKNYIEEVALPGVYKLIEMTEFKWVMIGFMITFVLIVTILSTLPLMKILKSSIEQESQMRALTIARTIARLNRKNLINGLESAVTVEFANKEPGVQQAYIISSVDGHILAPNSNQQYPKEPFIHAGRTSGKEFVRQISDSKVGAMVPIEFYNPNTGSQGIIAYSAVVYNMGALAVDDGRVISLFIQTLFISTIFGSILFYFLYQLINQPIKHINRQVNHSMQNDNQLIENKYKYPQLDKLVDNINSLLARSTSSQESEESITIYDRNQEIENLLSLIISPTLIYLPSNMIVAGVNSSFEELTSLSNNMLMNQPLETITDQALYQNIKELINTATENPSFAPSDRLEISGYYYILQAQSIYGDNSIAYVLVTINLEEGG